MRAAVLTEPGVPTAADFEEPSAGDGLEVARVLVAGLNPADLAMSAGRFGPLTLPSVAGIEGIAELADGRRVYFQRPPAPFGSMAERAPIDVEQAFVLPDGLEEGLAVSLGVAGLAAWLPLRWKADLQPGESVLVLGASGIVGRIAVQAAKLMGAGRVVGAARDQGALESVRDLGADDTVALQGDFAAALKQASGDGFDVVLDPVFGAPYEAALAATARGARLISIGGSAGYSATVTLGALMGRSLFGHSNGDAPLEVRRASFAEMAEHARHGRLEVPVARIGLDQVREAWERQASSPHEKLVIVP